MPMHLYNCYTITYTIYLLKIVMLYVFIIYDSDNIMYLYYYYDKRTVYSPKLV